MKHATTDLVRSADAGSSLSYWMPRARDPESEKGIASNSSASHLVLLHIKGSGEGLVKVLPRAVSIWEPSAKSFRSQSVQLVLFLADLLAITLACKRFLDSLLLAWFQVEGVALHFLDDVFRLHFALKAAQRILKGFAFLDTYFCQDRYTSKLCPTGYFN